MDLKPQDGGDKEQARDKSEDISSLSISNNIKDKSDHDGRPSSTSEHNNNTKKKKKCSKTKTSSKSSSRRKDASDDKGKSGDLLGKSHHSAMKRRANLKGKKSTIKTRRQSMGAITEGSKKIEPSEQDGHQSTSTHGKGSKQSDHSPKSRSNRSISVHSVSCSTDIDSDLSKNDFSQPSSCRSFDTNESKDDPGKPSSSCSLMSVQSKKNRSRPSSNRSLNSLNLSSHSQSNLNLDVRIKSFGTADFDSDLEDDGGVKCSVTDIPLVLNDCEKDSEAPLVITPNGKDSFESQQRSREDNKNIRDLDAKQRHSRQPQLSKTDDLGRASSHSHSKVERVYCNQKSESKVKKVGSYDSDDVEEEIEVLTKLSPSSNDTDRSATKGRFRSRRRASIGNDQPSRTRSRSREPPPSMKDFSRMRSARSPDRLGTRSPKIKSSDKRIKRGTDVNAVTPESKEAVKKLSGSDTPSSEEFVKNTNQESPTETENTSSESQPSSTTSTMNAKECATNSDNSSKKINSSMQDFEKKQRRRCSIGRTMRKDKTPTRSREVAKKPFGSDAPSLEEDQKSHSGTEKTISESQPSSTTSMKDTEEILSIVENSSKKINSPKKDLEKKQRRRCSIGRAIRKDNTPSESEEEVKKLLGLDTPSFEEEPIAAKSTDQKPLTESEHTEPESQPSSATSIKDAEDGILNTESTIKKIDSPSQDLEKRRRRRRNVESQMLKDKPVSRIPTKSGHKSSKKSTRERKSRDSGKKNDPDSKLGRLSNSTYDSTLSSGEFVDSEEFVVGDAQTEETRKYEAEESMKIQRSPEKSKKRNKSSSRRRSSTKEKKSRGRDSSDKDSIDQSDLSKKSDTGTDDDEEKDNEFAEDDNYLQLTFVAENFADTDNLFALMDERLHRSFNQSFSEDIPHTTQRSEVNDKGSSIRSYISFAEEIDLKVSTTSFSLSRSTHDAGVVKNDFYGDDDADDVFRHDGDGFANDIVELTTPKNKRLTTPILRKKEGLSPPFGLSKSLHSPRPSADNSFTGVREEIKKAKKRSLLEKMRVGITEGAVSSRHLLAKAASTRNMLGQATTKVLARKKEEGRGLLMDDSDSESRP